MFNPESTKVSYFRPPVAPVKGPDGRVVKSANQTPNGSLTIYQVYRLVLGEGNRNNLRKLTETLRSIEDKDEAGTYKKTEFPFITFGGEFSPSRSIKNLTSTSNLVVLDFDHIGPTEEVETLKQRLSQDRELDPILLFISPSGDGLKVVVNIRQEIHGDEDFKRAIRSLSNYLRQTYDLNLDPSGKDICRTCFLPYDPTAIYQEAGEGFDVEKWTPPVEAPRPQVPQGRPLGETMGLTGGPSDFDRALIAVEDIERSGRCLTDEYSDWRDIGFALSNLGEAGRDLFHRLSSMSSKYKPESTDRLFSDSLRSGYTGKRIELETLFKRAKDAGVSLRSSNVYSRPQTRQTPRGNQPSGSYDVPPVGPQDDPDGYVVREAQEPSPKWLLAPTTETEVIERGKQRPPSLTTGYCFKGHKFRLLSGKLTEIAGPSGHGKTLFLLNLLLNVAKLNPERRFVLFTYEEDSDTMIQYLLNIYLSDLNLMKRGREETNREILSSYFGGNGTEWFNPDSVSDFYKRKDLFFRQYIETGRILIKYIESDSGELCRFIEFLSAPENNIGGVFVDYFQYINPDPSKKFPTRQEALKSICIELKDIANKTQLPVVLACQFNQEVLSPTDVLLTKIGEAGDISRIGSECVGLWQMGKDIGRKLDNKDEQRVEALNAKNLGIKAMDNYLKGMFMRVLKSRVVETGSEEMFKFRGLTGKIYPNDTEETTLLVEDWDRPDPSLPLDDLPL